MEVVMLDDESEDGRDEGQDEVMGESHALDTGPMLPGSMSPGPGPRSGPPGPMSHGGLPGPN